MKGYLLDTHVFLWVTTSPERLNVSLHKLIMSLDEPFYVSAASVWEIAQKRALNKLRFDGDVSSSIETHTMIELPVRGIHCETAAELPLHHRDPFDRLLIAQAFIENLILVSRDKVMAEYDVALLRA